MANDEPMAPIPEAGPFHGGRIQWLIHLDRPAVTQKNPDGSVIVHINPAGGKSRLLMPAALLATRKKTHQEE